MTENCTTRSFYAAIYGKIRDYSSMQKVMPGGSGKTGEIGKEVKFIRFGTKFSVCQYF